MHWFQQQVSYSIFDSNISATTRFLFFKDAQDLLNYRAHMLLGGIRAGLPPEKIITLISKSIQSNRWPVHLFAIEVGARGYCSTDVKSCLSRPGFMSKLLTLTIKKLSLSSLKVPFQLWLSRDCESGLRKQWQYPP